MRHLMKCGCVAQGHMTIIGGKPIDPPIPVCVVHDCTDIVKDMPDLTGRVARCSCGNTKPSSYDLAFFEYRGEGSKSAEQTCVCGYDKAPHDPDNPYHHNIKCRDFRPRGPKDDLYYCGCRGWD